MAAPALSLQVLGVPAAWVGGAPAPGEVLWRTHLALLAYLALAPGRRATRAHLHGLLWPEVDEERARRSLNEAVRRLRLHLGRDRLRTSGDVLELDGAGLSVDANDATGWPSPDLPLPELLQGFALEGAEAFDAWLERERGRVRDRMIEAALERAEAALARGSVRAATEWAARIAEGDPCSARGAMLRMRALALAGDPGAALAAHQHHVAALRALGGEPLAEVTALASRLRDAAPAPGAVPARRLPLVGRGAIHARLFGMLDEVARAGARLVAVSGAPGMGKSRVLQALGERARLGGHSVLGVPLPGAGDPAPWGLLRALLRAGLATLPGARATAPAALGVLATLAPDAVAATPAGADPDEGAVVAALTALLQAVADERPLVVAIDDADASDPRSIAALHDAVRALPRAPLLLAVAVAPPSPDMPVALLTMLADLGRGVAGVHLALEPLTAAEVRELVREAAPWCAGEGERDRLARRLLYETEGDPLLCTTLLDSLEELTHARVDMLEWPPPNLTLESPLPVPVPVVLHTLLLARIARVSPGDRTVLGAAAVAGTDVDDATVAAMVGEPVAQVEAALARLERARLLESDGLRHRFAAPLIATLARHICLTSAERRQAARRALEVLPEPRDLASLLQHASLQLAARDTAGAARTALQLLAEGDTSELARPVRVAVEQVLEALRGASDATPAREALRAGLARHRAARPPSPT